MQPIALAKVVNNFKMATQFMSPTAYVSGLPSNGYVGYSNNRNGGFSFRKRVERVDWRKIASVDIDHISRTLDFNTLQENIMNITFCNLEAELDIRSVDPNFIKLFKLAQLTIEYLLHSQEYLAGLCASLEEKCKLSDQQVEKTKQELADFQKELAEVKKESHRRKKLLIAQQQLMYAGNESYNKCPFCAKAFLNNGYLQSHITRRHAGISKDGSSSVSPDLGVGSESGRNHLEMELNQIKEQMLKQQAELDAEKRALQSLKSKDARVVEAQVKQIASVPTEVMEQDEGETKISIALMKEIKELTAKYQSSQKALLELEARTGSKRSNLGFMEDDTENDRLEVKEQKLEIASMKQQLQQQLDQMKEIMQTKLEKQERKWQKKMHAVTKQHAQETKKLNNALDTTARSQEIVSSTQQAVNHRQEVEKLLKQSREREKALEVEVQEIEQEIQHTTEVKQLLTPRSKSPRVKYQQNINGSHEQAIVAESVSSKRLTMYPSDEDSAEFGTGTSSLRTIGRETPRSTLNQSGTLHTNEFIEGLRKNPTLALIRDQLAEVLQDYMEKNGIPKSQTGISDQVLENKLNLLQTQRQVYQQKYPNFMELRERFNKKATEEARRQLKMQLSSPRGPPPAGPRRRLELSPRTPHQHQPFSSGPRTGPPHPQQHLSGKRTTPRSSSGPPSLPGSKPQPQPRAASAQRTPLSTGSTTEWTSTQFDSDESDDENTAVKQFVSAPQTRLIQSGPAKVPTGGPSPSPRTQVPKTRVIHSKPLNNNADDDLDDMDDILNSDRQPVSNVATLTKKIEKQLESRQSMSKPTGGVDTVTSGTTKKIIDMGYSDEESEWDSTTAQNEPAPLPQKRLAPNRASTDGMSTNTYASSAWGSTGNPASTAKDKERRSTSRSSHYSITSVSSDEDMNVDNI
ncbi:hypothetical protein Btru_028421 [Bulinus truncatus]|nr:hypothetical protein Btru_028421 [Bulinus truncatus]